MKELRAHSSLATTVIALLMILGVLTACGPTTPAEPHESVTSPAAGQGQGGAGQSSPSPSDTSSPEPSAETLSWGPTKAEAAEAKEIVQDMSVAEQAGQVLMASLPGTQRIDSAVIASTKLGGLILMETNISTAAGTKKLTAAFDAASRKASGHDVPALIGIDQEGGLVQRYFKKETPFPTAMAYGAIYEIDPEEATELAAEGYRRLGTQLTELGVTMDFAPVADVTAGATDPVIGARSFSGKPAAVSALVRAASTGLTQAGLLPVIKHFPGHGSVSTDSHYGLPVYDQPLEELKSTQWQPFVDAISDGIPAVMSGHLATPDAPTVPATVKKANYTTLKEELGFEGLNVTDAMNMGAIVNQYGSAQASVAALKAGADLVVMPADVAQAHAGIVSAVSAKELSAARLADAATTVITAKLYQQRLLADQDVEDAGSDSAFIELVFAKAITDLSGQCTPTASASAASSVIGADATQQQLLRTALADVDAEGTATGAPGAGTVALIGVDQLSVDAATAVTLNSPWPLARSRAQHKYALYGRGPAAMAALAKVLSGAAPAPGKLPVTVGEYPAGTGCGTATD
ncbi:glycoside hydrolase family 3 protein [Micrococcoides hystricis]|uniref:beta-N-acetylhexosaminidase n=1 Tax=Micrococcoides hystricis TaxID=1572761 RepID=A0ABV6P9Y6_9MICC